MANMPNGMGRQGNKSKSPSRTAEETLRQEISLIYGAAKRANADFVGRGPSPDDKRMILNQLSLKSINKIKNVNALMNIMGENQQWVTKT